VLVISTDGPVKATDPPPGEPEQPGKTTRQAQRPKRAKNERVPDLIESMILPGKMTDIVPVVDIGPIGRKY